MRPEALELDGFTVFRETTRIDFADTGLFAFTGPTGAGKSSLIDAMIFALYGSVPRLDERTVAPVISQGRQDARVRLDFALGEQLYTAIRVVRRGKDGTASTREARLQCDDEVLAGNVRELDAQIRRLLGLDFRQFTTCAVLPQGEFARFLHAPPAERQKLLTQLLGFGVYGALRQRATQKAAIGRDGMDRAQRRLDDLADVNKKVERTCAARLDGLRKLQDETADELSCMDVLQREIDAIAPRRKGFAVQLKALRAVRMPSEVRELASDVLAATQAVQVAQQARALATAEWEGAEEGRSALGDKSALEETRWLHGMQEDLKRKLAAAVKSTAQARTNDDQRKTALKLASDAVASARQALEAARRTHSAHELRGHLVAGESCPVCEQMVEELPVGEKPLALVDLEEAERRANQVLDAARREQLASAAALAEATRDESVFDGDLKETWERLDGAASLEVVVDQLAQIADADEKLGEVKQRLDDSSQALIDAQEDRQAVRVREGAAWTAYHSVRDTLSALTPPPAKTDDLPGSWVELQQWATKSIPSIAEKDDGLREQAERIGTDLESRSSRLAGRFEEHEVTLDDDPMRNLQNFVTQAGIALDAVRKDRKEKKSLRNEIKVTKAHIDVAETLALHLRANGFERWLMHEAFGRLAASASKRLLDLSNKQYEFRQDERLGFNIVDHTNAGEARSARTLSGGETFLASLSLALALADEVADLATEGTARLESIFLDEGFGTLDPDTLDIVATAIEELGARGRMVGVVTHVPDLAQRMPVQFKVSKASGSASVERVET